MDATSLKILALVLMVGDHVAEFFEWGFSEWMFLGLRYLGRLSAPVFFYLSIESVFKTRDRKKYLKRLYGAAVLTGLGNWMLYGLARMRFGGGVEPVGHNILVTIALGVTLVMWLEWVKVKRRRMDKLIGWVMVGFLSVIMLFGEFSFWALGMYWLFYLFWGNNKKLWMNFAVFSGADLIRARFWGLGEFLREDYQWLMVGVLPLLYFYNGKRGRGLKWWFYVFYPVHLWVLYWLGYGLT